MPAWWGKKSSSNKNKEDTTPSPKTKRRDSSNNNNYNNDNNNNKVGVNFTNSPRVSREIGGGSAVFSGFDSDCGEKRKGHPLPVPYVNNNDHGVAVATVVAGSGSVSGSVSSISSTGSYGEDHPERNDQYRSPVDRRGNGEIKLAMRSRSPCPGSRSPRPGSRSPGPASRGPSRPASPLHSRLASTSLDSPGGRSDDGKSQCHPLPLPPSSPNSPSSLTRNNGSSENTHATLSKWKKGKLLGRGTFGHVYLGFNRESGQMCAIKEVRVVSDDHTSKECLKQLNQEINLLNQLSHPNIVRYYGSELSEETLSVYLEYVSGGSIHKLLQEYGPFGEPVIQNYTRQILSGLAYLHCRNTVHRDIKGANILVDPNGEIKLADFGMAKHITSYSSMLSFKGSPYWMAPEVVMNTNGYSLHVDIWSLGCTILEMATAKPPWNQYEGVAAIFKIGNSKDMPYIPDHLSNDAKNFIKLCLQRDPAARPTAAKLLEHPFVWDQSATRTGNMNVTSPRDAFPCNIDGSRTPPALEFHSNRMSVIPGGPATVNVRAIRSPRDDVRAFTSLPVSPSSSPLRQHGPAHRSCLLSPPHPTYALMGQNGYNLNDYSLSPSRLTAPYTHDPTPYTHDPFLEPSSLKSQIPSPSTRTRII